MASPRPGDTGQSAFARTILLIGAVLLAFEVVRIDLARWLEPRDPALGHAIAPGDARLAAALAARRLRDHPDRRDPIGLTLARGAVEREAGLVPAIEILALDADRQGHTARAGQLMAAADTLSRRSLPTRLWLIEQAVAANRPAEALRHYGIALATIPDSSGILFPSLSRAVEAPDLAQPIAHLVNQPSEWRIGFLGYAIDHASPGAAFGLVMSQSDRTNLRGAGLDQRLTARLLTTARFDLAKQVEQVFAPCRSCSEPVVDARFWPITRRFPFGWNLTESGALGAVSQRDGQQGQLHIEAGPLQGGVVARQLLMLAPGRYTLASAWAPGPRAHVLWRLSCAPVGTVVVEMALPESGAPHAQSSFDVKPAACPAQWLALDVLPSSQTEGQTGTLTYVTVRGGK